MLKDKTDSDYLFKEEDYNIFNPEFIYDTSTECNSKRKTVQSKLLYLHDKLYPILQDNGYKLYKHYSDTNITSLPYCTPYANNNKVEWVGLRYGQHPDIVKEIDKDADKGNKDQDYGFLLYQCMQISVTEKGLEIGFCHSIPRDSFDRGYVHEMLEENNTEFKDKLITALSKFKGHNICWYASNGTFEFDYDDINTFPDFYEYFDRPHTYSMCYIKIDRKSRLLLRENIVQTCLDYIDLMYEVFELTRWKKK